MAADTRQRIIEEATKLFGRRGFAGTSVAELEEAAGLKPKATIFGRPERSFRRITRLTAERKS